MSAASVLHPACWPRKQDHACSRQQQGTGQLAACASVIVLRFRECIITLMTLYVRQRMHRTAAGDAGRSRQHGMPTSCCYLSSPHPCSPVLCEQWVVHHLAQQQAISHILDACGRLRSSRHSSSGSSTTTLKDSVEVDAMPETQTKKLCRRCYRLYGNMLLMMHVRWAAAVQRMLCRAGVMHASSCWCHHTTHARRHAHLIL